MTLAELNVLINANTSGLNSGLNQATGNLRNFQTGVSRMTGSISASFAPMIKMFAALKIGDYIRDSISSGMESIESENLFGVVMGNMEGQARQFSETLQQQFGLNGYEVRKNTAMLYGMAQGLGFTNDQAYAMSEQMTKLSYDMASFYNLKPEEAFQKLSSAMVGETDGLKSLGIVLNDATIKQYAYTNGIAKQGSELSTTQKSLAIYQLMLDRTSNAQGDLARTINSPSNQLRILRSQLQLLSITLGQAFMPIVTAVLPILNAFVAKLQIVAQYVAAFMNYLFGTSSGASSAGQQTTANNKLSQSYDNLGKSIAGASAKAKGSVAGFDEVNQLTPPSEMSGGGGTGGLDPGAIEGVQSAIDNANKALEGMKGTLEKIELPQGLKDIADKMKEIAGPIGNLLNQVLKDIFWMPGNFSLTDSIVGLLDILGKVATFLTENPIGKAIRIMLEGIIAWDIAKTIGGPILRAADDVIALKNTIAGFDFAAFGQKIADGAVKVADFAVKVKDAIVQVAIWTKELILNGIEHAKNAASAVISTISDFAVRVKDAAVAVGLWTKELILNGIEHAKNIAATVINTIVDFASKVKTAAIEVATWTAKTIAHGVASAATAIKQGIMTAATVVWTGVTTVATAVTTAFGAAIAFLTSPIGLVILAITALIAIGVVLYKNWDSVSKFCKEVWNGIWDTIKPVVDKLINLFPGITSSISQVFTGVKQIFGGIIDFITGVFTGNWSKAWNGVVSIFSGIINGIVGIMKYPINAMIDLINVFLRGLNKLKIPDWVPGVGGKGINIPLIPHLARGGIIDKPTVAEIGEAGPEMVVPLENTSFVNSLASALGNAVMNAMTVAGANGKSSGEQTIVLKVNDTVFGEVAINAINKVNRSAGESLLVY